MIFNSILNFIINQILGLAEFFINFLFTPILKILETIVPDINLFFTNVYQLFINYIFPGARFFKMALMNLTGLNNVFFVVIVSIIAFKLYILYVGMITKFALNVYKLFKKGETD